MNHIENDITEFLEGIKNNQFSLDSTDEYDGTLFYDEQKIAAWFRAKLTEAEACGAERMRVAVFNTVKKLQEIDPESNGRFNTCNEILFALDTLPVENKEV